MKLMTKKECSQWLKCEVEDVDAVMGVYGIHPIGTVNGRGGGYLPLLAPGVAEFEAKKAKLEGELRQLIHDATEEATNAGGSLGFLAKSIAAELRLSEGPQNFPDAFHQFAVQLDAQVG